MDLLKPQLVAQQLDTPSYPLSPDTTSVNVVGKAYSSPLGISVRRTLMGLFPGGVVRQIATLWWPDETTKTVLDATALRVWVHEDPSEPIGLGEQITVN